MSSTGPNDHSGSTISTISDFGYETHYETLGLRDTATEFGIRRAYLVMATRWHPDKNPEDVEYATRRFQAIQKAHSTLNDPRARMLYDISLGIHSRGLGFYCGQPAYHSTPNLGTYSNNNYERARAAEWRGVVPETGGPSGFNTRRQRTNFYCDGSQQQQRYCYSPDDHGPYGYPSEGSRWSSESGDENGSGQDEQADEEEADMEIGVEEQSQDSSHIDSDPEDSADDPNDENPLRFSTSSDSSSSSSSAVSSSIAFSSESTNSSGTSSPRNGGPGPGPGNISFFLLPPSGGSTAPQTQSPPSASASRSRGSQDNTPEGSSPPEAARAARPLSFRNNSYPQINDQWYAEMFYEAAFAQKNYERAHWRWR